VILNTLVFLLTVCRIATTSKAEAHLELAARGAQSNIPSNLGLVKIATAVAAGLCLPSRLLDWEVGLYGDVLVDHTLPRGGPCPFDVPDKFWSSKTVTQPCISLVFMSCSTWYNNDEFTLQLVS
jgi:hypothetical protein